MRDRSASRFRLRLTYANVMATIAVFIALGGTSYAVSKLPSNSVGSAQIRAGAVTSAKIRDATIAPGDLSAAARSLGARGPRGAQGPPGSQGATGGPGAPGPRGPADIIVRRRDAGVNTGFGASSYVDVATFTLPAGKWLIQAVTNAINFNAGSIFRCSVFINGTEAGANQAVSVGNGPGTALGAILAPAATVDSVTESQVILRCGHDSAIPAGPDIPRFERTRVTAIRTDNLDVKDI